MPRTLLCTMVSVAHVWTFYFQKHGGIFSHRWHQQHGQQQADVSVAVTSFTDIADGFGRIVGGGDGGSHDDDLIGAESFYLKR